MQNKANDTQETDGRGAEYVPFWLRRRICPVLAGRRICPALAAASNMFRFGALPRHCR